MDKIGGVPLKTSICSCPLGPYCPATIGIYSLCRLYHSTNGVSPCHSNLFQSGLDRVKLCLLSEEANVEGLEFKFSLDEEIESSCSD